MVCFKDLIIKFGHQVATLGVICLMLGVALISPVFATLSSTLGVELHVTPSVGQLDLTVDC